jgi:signal-transduction protein with cAMP-binding, CBS, and nucleotidyltransferase domain
MAKGDEQMFKRFAWLILVVMLANLAGNLFISAEAKTLALSEALAKAKWFEDLTNAERDELRSAATMRHCKAGERIIEQGKATQKMFIILNGKADVLISGKRIVSLSGEFLVGEIEFLDMLPASADVVLLQETDIIELSNAALSSLMDKQPRIGYVLMCELAKIEAERLRQTSARWGGQN